MKTTRQRLNDAMERTDLYATVVKVLCAEAHKPITMRLANKVNDALKQAHGDADYEVRLTKSCGMTNVEFGGYTRHHGNRGHSILIAYSVKSAPIEQRHVDDMKRYLASKHERNANRERILATNTPERMDAAIAAIREGLGWLQEIHDTGENHWVLPSPSSILDEIGKER